MLQKSWVYVFVVLLLESFIQRVNGIPSPAVNSWCSCIRAKDCIPFKRQLINSRMDQLSGVVEQIRNSGCGLTALSEPMICCPTRMETFGFTSHHHSMPMNDHWVWDRRAIMIDENSDGIDMENKFIKNEYRFMGTNLIDDYVDWKTRRNCPPILFKETNSRFHKKFRGHDMMNEDHLHNLHRFHHHPPDHFDFDGYISPHGFQHHSPHHNRFGEDYETNEDDNPHSGSKHTIWPAELPNLHEPRTQSRPETTSRTTRTFSTEITTTTQSAPLTPPMVNTPSCGVTLNKRIIGGIEALPGEFPWITRIAYLNQTDNSIAYRCTGSFISELHILTAAHCVANLDANLNLSHVSLVGANTTADCNNQNMPCQDPQNIFEIVETIVHPNYDNPRRANDIAILKINKPPNTESNYGTICLPPTSLINNTSIGSTAIVAGWSNNEGTDSNDLQVRYLKLRIMNNSDCADSYNTFREGFAEKISIISSMVCTQGQANGSDVCRGDSGGPLMDDGTSGVFNREGRYTLLGIVAFGPICGLTNLLPGVYMRVSEYVDWIVNNVR